MRAPVVVVIAGAAGLVGFFAGREVAPHRARPDDRTVRAAPEQPRPPVHPAERDPEPSPPLEKPERVRTELLPRTPSLPTGELHGIVRAHHKNGTLLQEGTFEHGKAIGIHRRWYDNGRLHREDSYVAGKRDGVTTVWRADGRLQSQEHWREGLRHGLSTFYDADGKRVQEGIYESGKLIGPLQIFGSFGADADLERKATMGDKYSTLLMRVAIASDKDQYGALKDWGHAKAMRYAGVDVPAGHWVYVYPYWYVWKDKTDG